MLNKDVILNASLSLWSCLDWANCHQQGSCDAAGPIVVNQSCQLHQRRWTYYGASLTMSLIFMFAVFLNLGIVLLYLTHHFLRNFSEALIVNLAVADLLTSVIAAIKTFPVDPLVSNSDSCFAVLVLVYVFCCMSLFGMTSISVERYCMVRFPIKYRHMKTSRKCLWVMILTPWVLVLALFAVPLLVHMDLQHKRVGYISGQSESCYSVFHDYQRPEMILFEILAQLISLVVLVCFNVLICCKLPTLPLPSVVREASPTPVPPKSTVRKAQSDSRRIGPQLIQINPSNSTIVGMGSANVDNARYSRPTDEDNAVGPSSRTGGHRGTVVDDKPLDNKLTEETRLLRPASVVGHSSSEMGTELLKNREERVSFMELPDRLEAHRGSESDSQRNKKSSETVSETPYYSRAQYADSVRLRETGKGLRSMIKNRSDSTSTAGRVYGDNEDQPTEQKERDTIPNISSTRQSDWQQRKTRRMLRPQTLDEEMSHTDISSVSTSGNVPAPRAGDSATATACLCLTARSDKSRKTSPGSISSRKSRTLHQDGSVRSIILPPPQAGDRAPALCLCLAPKPRKPRNITTASIISKDARPLQQESSIRSSLSLWSRSDVTDSILRVSSRLVRRPQKRKAQKAERQMSGHFLLFILTLTTLVTWLPYVVTRVIELVYVVYVHTDWDCYIVDPCYIGRQITLWIVYLQSTCNPLLYAFFHRNFKAALRSIKRKHFRAKVNAAW